ATCSACAVVETLIRSFTGGGRLGLDDRLDATLLLAALARAHLVEVGALVDENVVAGDLVAAAVDARLVEQLDLLVAVVELDAQRLALDPDAFLLARLR